mmetsp:Transcript_27202/g.48095  ORF Transcript_27202/g.48095 Transcript_27202/m.48095 type:complete len:480 (-) Transcript_27202:279-1718(-)
MQAKKAPPPPAPDLFMEDESWALPNIGEPFGALSSFPERLPSPGLDNGLFDSPPLAVSPSSRATGGTLPPLEKDPDALSRPDLMERKKKEIQSQPGAMLVLSGPARGAGSGEKESVSEWLKDTTPVRGMAVKVEDPTAFTPLKLGSSENVKDAGSSEDGIHVGSERAASAESQPNQYEGIGIPSKEDNHYRSSLSGLASESGLELPSALSLLGAPPGGPTVVGDIGEAATNPTVCCLSDMLEDTNMENKLSWRTRLKNATNFDLFAPGLITLLDFDGIELWAMDSKNGDVVNIADTVRDEVLLKWSYDSNSWRLAAGKGMIGRVFLTGVAEWENDISKVADHVFLRCPIAQRLKVKGVGCIPCEAPTGDKLIVFMYSRKELGFDKDKQRKKFVEEMIYKWMTPANTNVKFLSTKKPVMQMVTRKKGEETNDKKSRVAYEKKPAKPLTPKAKKSSSPKEKEDDVPTQKRRRSKSEHNSDV